MQLNEHKQTLVRFQSSTDKHTDVEKCTHLYRISHFTVS